MSVSRSSGTPLPLSLNRRRGWGLVAAAAIAVGLYAVPPYLLLDPLLSRIPLNLAFPSHLSWLFLHAASGGLALLIGPFQFHPALRARWPQLHRLGGRVYLACILVGGIAAVPVTVMTTAGFAAQVGFGLLVVAWLYSAFHAYRAVRERRFADHRIWMIRNYALTFAAVLLRVILIAGMVAMPFVPSLSFEQIYIVSIWGSITVSALAAEWFIITTARGGASFTARPETP